MNNLYILIGVSGSGKTRFVRKMHELNENKTLKVVSSDEIRKEKNYGQTPEEHQKVFTQMRRDTIDYLRYNDNITVIYDATNLNRKKRIELYNEVKRIIPDVEITATVFVEPLSVLLKNNLAKPKDEQVPERVIRNMYTQLQIPRKEVDCDIIEVMTQTPFYKDEYKSIHHYIRQIENNSKEFDLAQISSLLKDE